MDYRELGNLLGGKISSIPWKCWTNSKSIQKNKVRMNILFCRMVAMPIVCLALKIDVMKMEQAFQMGYKEGERAFYIVENSSSTS